MLMKQIRIMKVFLSIFAPCGIPLGKSKPSLLTNKEFSQARDYVLINCDEVEPY